MIESEYLSDDNKLMQRLRKIPTLSNFQMEHLGGMLKLSKIRKYEPGELIIEEGKYDNWVYFLVSGRVRVVKHEVEINVLDQTGEVFNLFQSRPRQTKLNQEAGSSVRARRG